MSDDKGKQEQVRQDDVSDSGLERKPGGLVGAVPEASPSPDEINAEDPVTASGVATEERLSSSAAGLSADDPDAGEERKKAYARGATLVSRID